MGLDFSPKVADFSMLGFYSPSLSYMLQGFSPQCIICTALLLGFPYFHNSSSGQVLWEIDFVQPSSWISTSLERVPCKIKEMIKENSPELVMRITSVPQLLTCTKAPSPTTSSFDSCHGRVIRNQQNLFPTFLLLP